MPSEKDFRGWYLGCARGHFEREAARKGIDVRYYAPEFADVAAHFFGFPAGDSVLYLPIYPNGTHERYLRREDAIIKGHRISSSRKEGFRGRIEYIFKEFGDMIGEGPDKPKIVVVDWGYYTMSDFLRSNYGWITELR